MEPSLNQNKHPKKSSSCKSQEPITPDHVYLEEVNFTQTNRPRCAQIALDIKINDHFLIARCLSAMQPQQFLAGQIDQKILNLQEKAWKISQTGYNFLVGGFGPYSILDASPIAAGQESQLLLDKLITTPEYLAVREETEERRCEVENQWDKLYQQSLSCMQDITGLSFDGESYEVFIGHPTLGEGAYLGNNRIVWGGRDCWQNYSTVYLWHEICHNDNKLGTEDQVSHAIIELATDHELRFRLDGTSYPPMTSRKELSLIKETLLPDWQAFLASTPRNIKNFAKKMRQLYGM